VAASLGDLIQIVANQRYLEQKCINVYFYRVTAPAGLADGYLDAFHTAFLAQVLDDVRGVQANLLNYESIIYRNLSNGIDLLEESVDLDGEVATTSATAMPSFVALTWLLRRESLATRNGYKRFAGVNDATVDGNSVNISSTLLDAVSDALSEDLMAGIAVLGEPVIVRKPLLVPAGTGYTYASIGDASFLGVSTQNTRKRGRGD
jgi:hypothetical protein